MSSGKQFEKTFSRRKDNNKPNDNKKRKDEEEKGKKKKKKRSNPLLTGLIIPSSSTESQQQHKEFSDVKPNEVNGEIDGTTSASNTKQKVKAKSQKPDKQKNGDVANSKQNHKQQNQEKHAMNKPEEQTQKEKRQLKDGDTDNAKKKKKQKNDNKSADKKPDDESEMVESAVCTFPTNRITKIIRSEGSDYRITQEAIFLINKATLLWRASYTQSYPCFLGNKFPWFELVPVNAIIVLSFRQFYRLLTRSHSYELRNQVAWSCSIVVLVSCHCSATCRFLKIIQLVMTTLACAYCIWSDNERKKIGSRGEELKQRSLSKRLLLPTKNVGDMLLLLAETRLAV